MKVFFVIWTIILLKQTALASCKLHKLCLLCGLLVTYEKKIVRILYKIAILTVRKESKLISEQLSKI